MSAGRKVDFIVAGVQKAGTSALFQYLSDIPALHLPAIKEAHFFDDETVDWANPDYARYHALFADDGALWGEATPVYAYWPNSLERIRAYNPAMKLILLFRDPIERAWSHWRMEHAKRKERKSFPWCIREGRARVEAGDPAAPGHHRVFSYVERGFYGAQIERLFRIFPARQCLALKTEELRERPDCVLRRVCTFLGVTPPRTRVTPRLVNAARDLDPPIRPGRDDVTLLATLFQPDLARFEALTGLSTADWVRRWHAAP